jgi:hypothetical protein
MEKTGLTTERRNTKDVQKDGPRRERREDGESD